MPNIDINIKLLFKYVFLEELECTTYTNSLEVWSGMKIRMQNQQYSKTTELLFIFSLKTFRHKNNPLLNSVIMKFSFKNFIQYCLFGLVK